jgi:hypothetical protein
MNVKVACAGAAVLSLLLGACGGGDTPAAPAPPPNVAPVVPNGTLAINEDQAGSVVIAATDGNGDALSAAITTPPTKGTASVTGSNPFTVAFVPTANSNGTDSIGFSVSDGHGGTTAASVAVTIAAQQDAPAIAALTLSATEDTTAAGQVGASDVDGDALTYTATSGPAHGSLTLNASSGAFTYSPAANYNGADLAQIQVSDGGRTASAALTINVAAVNDAPQAVDDGVTVSATQQSLLEVLANDLDPDGDALTLTIEQAPGGATAIVDAGRIRLTPAAGVSGPDRLRYRIADATGASSAATANIVFGAAAPVFYTTGAPNSAARRIRRFDYFSNVEIETPVPAGETLYRFTTSANGQRLAYVTEVTGSMPRRHRLWVKSLAAASAPVTEVPTAGNFFTNYLVLSADGAVLAFNDRVASAANPVAAAMIDDSGTAVGIEHPTFTSDGRYLYYTKVLSGGGRRILRAENTSPGVLGPRLQITADYAAAEGLGLRFRLTPDESKIVSLGLIFPPPGGGLIGIQQQAFVTSTDGSRDDTRLHPPFSSGLDNVPFLPVVTRDSAFALFSANLNLGARGLYSSPLATPAGNAMIASGNYIIDKITPVDGGVLYFANLGPLGDIWDRMVLANPASRATFMPAGVPDPSSFLAPAPDGTTVVMGYTQVVYATLGSQVAVASEIYRLPGTDVIEDLRYSPDSASGLLTGREVANAYVLNPKAHWSVTLDPAPFAEPPLNTISAVPRCLVYAGEGCVDLPVELPQR